MKTIGMNYSRKSIKKWIIITPILIAAIFLFSLLLGSGCEISFGCQGTQYWVSGPCGTVVHLAQEYSNYCTPACIQMYENFECFGIPHPQSQIMSWGDQNGDQYMNLYEAKEFLNVYAPNAPAYLNAIHIQDTPELTAAYVGNFLAICYAQTITPIWQINSGGLSYGHAIVLAGHTSVGGTPSYVLYMDPAGAGAERDKATQIEIDDLINVTIEVDSHFLFVSQLSLPTFAQDISNNNSISIEQVSDEDYHYIPKKEVVFPKNRADLPDFLTWEYDECDDRPEYDTIWHQSKYYADSAIKTLITPQNLENPFFMNRYGDLLFDSATHVSNVILSSATHWDYDDNVNIKMIAKPSIYLRVVEYSDGYGTVIAYVLLLHADPGKVLSIVAVPPKPDEMTLLKRTGENQNLYSIKPEHLKSIFGNVPIAFNSDRSAGVTGAYPMRDIPIWGVLDSATNEEHFFDNWGRELYIDENTGRFAYTGIRLSLADINKQDYDSNIPDDYILGQNFPNPFNPTTDISFTLPVEEKVTLTIYNIQGQRVKILTDDIYPAGTHILTWDGKNTSGLDVASGLYLYRLTAGSHNLSRKMMLVR